VSVNDNLPSEITSLNQNAIELIKDKKPKVKKTPPPENPCIVNTNILSTGYPIILTAPSKERAAPGEVIYNELA